MATETQIIDLSNAYEEAVAERNRVQGLVSSVGAKQSALAQQLADLNQRVAQLRVDLKQALQGN